MSDGNMWNKDFDGDRRKNHHRHPRQGNAHENKGAEHAPRSNRTAPVNPQTALLEDLVQQNHTIIGLLRGIKNILASGEYHQQNVPAVQQPVFTEPLTAKASEEIKTGLKQESIEKNSPASPKTEFPAPRHRRQFVMRFDDKPPLNRDLDDSESVPVPAEIPLQLLDENSIGENDPFEFFKSETDSSK